MNQTIDHISASPEWIVRIAQSLAGFVDLRAAISAMSDELKRLIPHDHIDVALLTEDRSALVVYETGLETSWGRKLSPVDISPIRDILYGNLDHMIFSNALEDDRVQFVGADTGPIRKYGLHSRLHHKIEISGTVVGVLSISSLQPQSYSTDHLGFIQTISNVAGPYFHALRDSAIAREKAVELERQKILRIETEYLVEVQEKERNRIGMDLHDHVLANMSRLLRNLDNPDLSEAQRLCEARMGLSSAIQDVRGIVEDARPALLEIFGLGTAIEAHLIAATKGAGLKGTMATPPEVIDQQLIIHQRDKLVLFRIIQEAINNAVWHAQASQITIELNQTSETTVSIEDNGIGFILSPRTRQSGLKNMNARAAVIGAGLQITSPGTGTRVVITLPNLSEDI